MTDIRPGALVYIRPRPRWLPACVWRRVRRWWPGLHMADGTPVYVERDVEESKRRMCADIEADLRLAVDAIEFMVANEPLIMGDDQEGTTR